MSSNFVLPTLSKWAEQAITSLYRATGEKAFDEAFDAAFTKDVKVTVNGHHLSREQYRKQLLSAKGLELGAQVAFTGAVEVPDNKEHGEGSGNVGLFVRATVDQSIVVFGEPESIAVTASYNLTIVQDSSIKGPHGPIRGDTDARRISVISQVSVDKRNPIGPPHSGSH